jgi:uncharacterized membrane protein YgdD (TMEM256/DUF423 family)
MAGGQRQIAGLDRANFRKKVASGHKAIMYTDNCKREVCIAMRKQTVLSRLWCGFGAVNGLAAVALAAVAAHAQLQPASLAALRSGVEIQGWHAAALLFCALRSGRLIDAAGAAFVVGTALFCAGVYAVAFANLHLGPIAPFGGTLLMVGWIFLILSAFSPNPT